MSTQSQYKKIPILGIIVPDEKLGNRVIFKGRIKTNKQIKKMIETEQEETEETEEVEEQNEGCSEPCE